MDEWKQLEQALHKLITELYGGINDPADQGEAEAYINSVYAQVAERTFGEQGD
jgi:hypothetical protein